MKDIVKGYLCAFISAFTYGLIPLFMIPIKKEESFSVDATLFYRFLIASGAIVFFLFYQKERLRISFGGVASRIRLCPGRGSER